VHRSMLSALEMMSTSAAVHPLVVLNAADDNHAVRASLLRMARALRFGSKSRAGQRLGVPVDGVGGQEATPPRGTPDTDLPGPRWVAQWFAEQAEALRRLLADTESQWHIEGDAAARGHQVHRPG
jgi:hypothetical protein